MIVVHNLQNETVVDQQAGAKIWGNGAGQSPMIRTICFDWKSAKEILFRTNEKLRR